MSDINEILLHSKFIKQKGYWEKKLSPDMSGTELLPDYKTLRSVKEELRKVEILIPEEVCSQLMTFSKRSDLSIYIVLLTVLKILVYRCTNNKDLTIISPVYIKNVSEDTINDRLFIRDGVTPGGTFIELLLEVRKSLLEAYENQDYPSDKLIEYLFYSTQVKNIDKNTISNIICLLGNIHDPRVVEDVKDKLIFSFIREGNSVRGHIAYPPGLYEQGLMEQISRYFSRMLENSLQNIKVKISEILFSSEEETKRFVYDFNDTQVDYPCEKTIHQLFEEQAARSPDSVAIVCKENGARSIEEAGEHLPLFVPLSHITITYKELNEKSNQLARLLRIKGVKPDRIAAIMADRSIETIIGILAILKAGGAYLPIDIQSPGPRKRFILEDSETSVLLTLKPIMDRNKEICCTISPDNILLLDNKDIYTGEVADLEKMNNPGDLAYVIYTSGTTGKPKGVMVEHRGVVNYTWWAAKQYVKKERVDFPLFTSISFDLTVTSIFTPLVTGNAIVVYEEEEEDKGLLIEKVIDENRVGVVKLTPSHLKLIRNKKIDGDGSNIRRLIVGGEDLKTALAKDIDKNFASVEIYNEYGPTEATVGCMIHKYDPAKDNRKSVAIGVPVDNLRIYLLDSQQKPVPQGVIGEIYISGEGVAREYLKQPELTAERFIPNPFVSGERMYRSGDLARMRQDGYIEFSGRVDQQVKIRGFRIELEEIENRLLTHSEIKEAVVTAREDKSGEKYLCAYIILHSGGAFDRRPSLSSELREYLSEELPDHMIPAFFTVIDKVPLTVNGKVDDKALPEPEITVEAEYVAPRSELEEKLAATWSEVLEIEKDLIGIDTNFFEIGGNSLRATILAAKIRKAFDVEVPLSKIFRMPFIRELSKYIKEADKAKFITIDPVEKKDYYVVSSPQKRLYILQQMESDNINYNVSDAVYLEGNVDIDRLQHIFKQLIQRHESLKTSFFMMNGEPVLKIHHHVDFKIEHWDSGSRHEAKGNGEWGNEPGESSINEIIDHFARPFDLSHPPLLRVGLLHTPSTPLGRSSQEGNSEDKHFLILMVDMHHIITDGISLGIFIQEFMALYEGEKLPPLRLHYKDYAQWQNRWIESGEIKKQEDYWMGVFNDGIPVLNLPLDFTRPAVQSFAGHTIRFEIGKKETEALKEMARLEGATMYMVFLAVYTIFLSKLSGQEDIIIGIPIGGRRHADLDQIVGMFVNTLAMRNFPAREKTFLEFLREVMKRSLAAFENQDYPFEDLKANVFENRDMPRNVLFDVFFQFNNLDDKLANIPEAKIEDLTIRPYHYKGWIAKFDLYLWGKEKESGILFFIEYATRLFREETVKSFIQYFKQIVSAIVRDNRIKLKDISITHDLLSTKSNILKQDQGDFGF
jgi:tyrocidine synthetase-3